MNRLLAEAFEAGVTFGPDDDPGWFSRLLDEVSAQRQATLLGLALRPRSNTSSAAITAAFRAAVDRFAAGSPAERDVVAHDPMFMIWLMEAVRWSTAATKDTDPGSPLDGFQQCWEAAAADVASPGLLMGQAIPVRRFDVDPLLVAVSPPTYEFPSAESDKNSKATAYGLPFFAEVGSVALGRISERWPELAPLIPKFVRLIVHVPDGTFRSASAARYTGVVFLTADDETLLDLEESIVHEYGHQVLYRIMELDPLIADQAGEFSLPWSGAIRDFYGYFHAFCIYMLLADYFARVIGVTAGSERERAVRRREAVLEGIAQAVDDFPDERFTPLGRRFLALARARARDLTRDSRLEVRA